MTLGGPKGLVFALVFSGLLIALGSLASAVAEEAFYLAAARFVVAIGVSYL